MIAVLFVSAFLRFDASIPVALLFIDAMSCFFLGLLWLLREINVVTVSVRMERLRRDAEKVFVEVKHQTVKDDSHKRTPPSDLADC